jgi:hypothetical protein
MARRRSRGAKIADSVSGDWKPNVGDKVPVPPPNKRLFEYDSFSEYLHFVDNATKLGHPDASRSASNSFAGTSYDKARELAEFGWPEGRDKVDMIRGRIAGEVRPVERPKFKAYRDFSGSEVEVGRYLSGVPECMMEHRREMAIAPRRSCRIVFGMSASAGISAEIMQIKGAATVALIDALELSGVSCEVWLDSTQDHDYSGQNNYSTHIKIKRSGEHVDIDGLAFQISHPSTFRRLDFAHMERTVRTLDNGYGMPCYPTLKGDIVISHMRLGDASFNTVEGAITWVAKQIENQTKPMDMALV